MDYSKIKEACDTGNLDLETFKNFLSHQHQKDKKNGFTSELFALLCEYGNLEIIQYICDDFEFNKHCSETTVTYSIREGITEAIKNNHLDIIKFLLKWDKNNMKVLCGFDNCKFFHYATKGNHIEIIRYFIEIFKPDTYFIATSWIKFYPIIYLCNNGHFDIFKYFIDQETNMKALEAYFMIACEYADLDTVKYLKEIKKVDTTINVSDDNSSEYEFNEEDSNDDDYEEYNAFKVNKFWNLAKINLFQNVVDKAILLACKNGNITIIEYLISTGHDLNTVSDLCFPGACAGGDLDTVKYLKDKGLNIHTFNDLAFCWACSEGNLNVVRYLVEECDDVDIHVGTDLGYFLASSNGQLNVVKYLVEECDGVDIYRSVKTKQTRYDSEICDDWDNFYDSDSSDEYYSSWFVYNNSFLEACKNGHLNVVEYLWGICEKYELFHIGIAFNHLCTIRSKDTKYFELIKFFLKHCRSHISISKGFLECCNSYYHATYSINIFRYFVKYERDNINIHSGFLESCGSGHDELLKYFIEECDCDAREALFFIMNIDEKNRYSSSCLALILDNYIEVFSKDDLTEILEFSYEHEDESVLKSLLSSNCKFKQDKDEFLLFIEFVLEEYGNKSYFYYPRKYYCEMLLKYYETTYQKFTIDQIKKFLSLKICKLSLDPQYSDFEYKGLNEYLNKRLDESYKEIEDIMTKDSNIPFDVSSHHILEYL